MARLCVVFALTPLLAVALAAQTRVDALARQRGVDVLAPQTGADALAAAIQRNKDVAAKHDYPAMLAATREVLRLAEPLGDELQVARCYRSIGAILYQLQDVPGALEAYRKGVEVSAANGYKDVEAQSWRGVSTAQNWLGQMREAFTSAERSLAISRELNDPVEVAGALIGLGNLYEETGAMRRSAEIYQEGLGIAERAHDDASIARLLTNLALLYSEQGDDSVALSYVERRLNDPHLPRTDTRSMARAWNVAALLYGKRGQFGEGMAAIERGLALMREPGGDKVLEAILLGQRGNLWRMQGNYAKALQDYRVFESTCREHEIPERRMVALESISSTLILMGRYEEALRAAEEGLGLVQTVGAQGVAWRFLTEVGVAYRRLGRLDEAEKTLREAIGSVESWHGQIAGGELDGLGFSSFAITPYRELTAIELQRNQVAEAFGLAERAKSRALSEVLARGRVQVTAAMTDAEKQREQSLAQTADRWNAAMMRGAGADLKTTAAFEKAAGELQSFRSSLYVAHPDLKVRRGEAPPLTLAETEALVPDAKTLLLEFAATDDAVYLLALRRGSDGKPAISAHRLAVKPAALQVQVEQFRQQLAARDLGYRARAQRLYSELLGPVEESLRSHSLVGIVPDGPLWELPFQALVDPGGKHMIERNAVFYAPSLTVILEGIGSHRAAAPRGSTLLAMGPPDNGLPRATEEVRALGRLYGAGSSKVLSGAVATEAQWKSEAPKYRILHLATHGVLNAANPMFSYVQLAADRPTTDDGMLEAREILDLDLHAELAVLSACETARGEVRGGEGIVGLSWALMMAGTPSVVVSQWKVDSASTTQLMLGFHRGIERGLTEQAPIKGKAEALRAAALELLHGEQFRHPFYWSGFQLLGNGY